MSTNQNHGHHEHHAHKSAQQLERERHIRHKQKLTLWALFAVFGLPLIAAIVLYSQTGSAWVQAWLQPNQYGLLVTPPQLFDPLVSQTNNKGKWAVLVMTTDFCEEHCHDLLNATSRLIRSMGKDQDRLQTWLVAAGETGVEKADDNFQQFARSPVAIQDFINQLPTKDNDKRADFLQRSVIHDRNTVISIFILDPLGYVMMMYPQDPDFDALRKDLVRLLKLSTAG